MTPEEAAYKLAEKLAGPVTNACRALDAVGKSSLSDDLRAFIGDLMRRVHAAEDASLAAYAAETKLFLALTVIDGLMPSNSRFFREKPEMVGYLKLAKGEKVEKREKREVK